MNPEFEIIETHSYRILRFGELVTELTENQRNVLKQVAEATHDERIAGIKLLRNISLLLPGDPWGLKCCRDMLDAMHAGLAGYEA